MFKPVGKAHLVLAAFAATLLAYGASPGRFDAPRRSGRRIDRVRKGRAWGWASSGRQTWSHRHRAGGDRENAPRRRPLWALALFALLITILQRTLAVVLVQVADSWRIKAGIWDAFAPGGGWGFSGNDSLLVIGELERTYALAGGTLPGVFAVGAVYESEGVIEGEPASPVHEYVFQLEQLIYRECACDDDEIQGLGIFADYYPRFPGSQIIDEAIGNSFVAGLIYTGLFPCRESDVLGAGYAWTELYQGGTNQEAVFELFYKAEITPRISIQPDLQYIVTPSGIHHDALAVGVRFQVAL